MISSDREPVDQRTGIGRRRFLTGLGVGVAGALTLNNVEALAETVEGPIPTSAPDPRFSRMFQLPAFARPDSKAVRDAMIDIGKPGGLLDAADPLSEGPVRLITNPELSPRNLDQDIHNMTAGTTFRGQFLDHDVTFDSTSRLGVVTEPTLTPNTRNPRLDLDSAYGGGPSVSPQLYSSSDRAKFRIESGGLFEDLPRNPDMSAIIADPRNDENLMIAGLQAAFLLAHNRTVDLQRANHVPGEHWLIARFTIMLHWQWIVVNEFLPRIVGRALVDDILRNGRRWYRFTKPTMPVEFQTGTYRFGHSLVRPSYRANLHGDPGGNPATGAPAFFGFIFDPAGEGQRDPVDLRGGARPSGGSSVGQRIAEFTGSPVLGSHHFPELRGYGLGLDASTPLWYYILREAQRIQQRRATWPGWGPDRRRDDHQNASAGQVFLPQYRLPPVPAEPDGRQVHDDRPAPMGTGGSRQPWPVARNTAHRRVTSRRPAQQISADYAS